MHTINFEYSALTYMTKVQRKDYQLSSRQKIAPGIFWISTFSITTTTYSFSWGTWTFNCGHQQELDRQSRHKTIEIWSRDLRSWNNFWMTSISPLLPDSLFVAVFPRLDLKVPSTPNLSHGQPIGSECYRPLIWWKFLIEFTPRCLLQTTKKILTPALGAYLCST